MSSNPFARRNPFQSPARRNPFQSPAFSDPHGQTKATPDHQRPSGGGQSIPSSGGSSGARRAREAEAQRVAEVARQAEQQRQAEARATAEATAEKQRILTQRAALIRQGQQRQVRTLRDADSGDRIRRETVKTNNQKHRVVISTNLRTGEKTYTEYKDGGSSRVGGGQSRSDVSSGRISRVEQSTIPGKAVLRTKTGEIILISSKGTVRVSESIAGEKLVIQDGVIVQRGEVTPERFVGEITSVTKDKGLTGLQTSIRQARGSINQKGVRASQSEQAKLVGLAFVGGIVDSVKGVIDTPKTVAYLSKNPSEIRNIPSQIARAGEEFGYLLTTSPGEGFAYLGGSYVGLKGTNAALRGLGSVSGKVITRLNPKFTGKAVVGKTLNIKVGNGRTVKVQVVNKIPKQTLERQVALAGRKVNAISSQGDSLIGFLNKWKGKQIRKPIPGEAGFNVKTKMLLKKFDSGKITRGEFRELDALIKKQGAKGLLERSFFADPSGKIRPSRLGITGDRRMKFIDYLTEDITFRKPKPQILLFDDVKVASFPKSLRTVARKLRTNKALNAREANALLEWQLRKSGKFKPVGFTTAEAEIIISPGELLKKVRKVGITEISGKRIPIVKVEIYRPTGAIKNLLNKYARGTITKAEELKLNRALRVKTGFNYGVSSSPVARARYVSIKRLGLQGLSGVRSSGRVLSRSSKGVSRTSRLSRSSRGVSRTSVSRASRGTSRKGGSGTSRAGTSRGGSGGSSRTGTSRGGSSRGGSRYVPRKGGSGYRPGRTPPKMPPKLRIPKTFKSQSLSRPVQTYYVVEKVRGKFKKLYPKPLTAKDAKDYAVYTIDNRLSKTAFFIPLGKASRVVRPPKQIQDYYSKNSQKVRPYRIRYGRRKKLVNGYIEKRKYWQDTPGERAQASRLRRTTQRARPRRKVTGQQRIMMLNNLRKARAIRMRNLQRRRR